MSFDGWRERVALTVYDEMIRAGTSLGYAGSVGHAVLAQLREDPGVPELFLIQRADSFGHLQDTVVRQLPPDDAKLLQQFDIRRMGRAARQAIAREFDVHLTEGEVGTEV